MSSPEALVPLTEAELRVQIAKALWNLDAKWHEEELGPDYGDDDEVNPRRADELYGSWEEPNPLIFGAADAPEDFPTILAEIKDSYLKRADAVLALPAMARRTDADLAQAAREQAAAAEARVIAMREAAVAVAKRDRRSDLAKDAGFSPEWQRHAERIGDEIAALPLPTTDALAKVIEEAKAEEREACAAQCERTAAEFRRAGLVDTARAFDSQAEAFRARGAAGTEGAR